MHEKSGRPTAGRFGAPVAITVEQASEFEIVATVATAKDRKWTVSASVEPDPPHRFVAYRDERKHDFKLEVREAAEADALTVADIERRCPIVMGDTSVWFDRGERYFDFSRLMEDCTVGLASVDGVPAAISCGAERRVLVGGQIKSMVTVSHLRVLPEHQRKGLWGAANSVLEKYWSHVDGSQAYIAAGNLGMQHGFANTPDKWPTVVQRVELDCSRLLAGAAGRASRRHRRRCGRDRPQAQRLPPRRGAVRALRRPGLRSAGGTCARPLRVGQGLDDRRRASGCPGRPGRPSAP